MRAHAGWAGGRCPFPPPHTLTQHLLCAARAGTEQTRQPSAVLEFTPWPGGPRKDRGGAGLPGEGKGAHTIDGGLPPVETARPPPPDWTCPCLDGQWQGRGAQVGLASGWRTPRGAAGGRAEGKAGPLTLLPAPPPSSAISSILGTWLDQYSEDFCQPPDWSVSHLEAAGGEGRTLKTAGQVCDASGPAAGRCLLRANSGDRQEAGQRGRLLPLLD